MFFLLNFEFIRTFKQQDTGCLLKSADYCARKFINSEQIDPDHFVRYCIKKAKRIVTDEPVPKEEEKAGMKRILKIYDQMYYSKVEENGEHTYEEDQSICEYTIPQFDGGNDSD